jgi:dipeptidyl aminopeptidase/acylaminoacyl peptidase
MAKRALLLAVCVLTPPLAADAARPVTFDDIMAMRRIETPVISPDGAHVLYVVRTWETSARDPQRKEARTQVWRVATADVATRQLTFDEAGATQQAWSPDARYISFLSARGSGADDRLAQVWLMRADAAKRGSSPTRRNRSRRTRGRPMASGSRTSGPKLVSWRIGESASATLRLSNSPTLCCSLLPCHRSSRQVPSSSAGRGRLPKCCS